MSAKNKNAMKPDPLTGRIVTMTPEWAAELLEKNPHNRSLSRNAVNVIARDMAAGHFRLNGDAIRVMEDGTLADGQHRLAACVKAGVPFQTFFVEGLTAEDAATLDRGRPRAVGDNLAIAYGIPNARLVAATIRNMVIYANRDLGATPTTAEIKTLYDLHPRVAYSCSRVGEVYPARPALLAAIHYIGMVTLGDDTRSNAFVHVFKSGIPDYEGCAAHALREVLLREKARKLHGTEHRHYTMFAWAWEKFATRTPVKSARAKTTLSITGWTPETLETPAPEFYEHPESELPPNDQLPLDRMPEEPMDDQPETPQDPLP